MGKLIGFMKEWAAVLFFATVIVLLLCALVVCSVQLSAKIGVFFCSLGVVGCCISIGIFINEIVYNIKDRRAK